MTVTVRYHALLRERTGLHQEEIELPAGATLAEVLARFSARFEALRGLVPSLHIAINDDFAQASDPLCDGDRVDLLPPYGGG